MTRTPERPRTLAQAATAKAIVCVAVGSAVLFVYPLMAKFRGSRNSTGDDLGVLGAVRVLGGYDSSVRLVCEVVKRTPNGNVRVLASQRVEPHTYKTHDSEGVLGAEFMARVGIVKDFPRNFRPDIKVRQTLVGGLWRRANWHPDRCYVRITSPTHTIQCQPPEHRPSLDEDVWDFTVTVAEPRRRSSHGCGTGSASPAVRARLARFTPSSVRSRHR